MPPHKTKLGSIKISIHNMKKISSLNNLSTELSIKKPTILGIDGKDGSGKSTLARKLATALNMTCIHIDSFIKSKNCDSYITALDLEKIDCHIQESKYPIIIEGICLLEILQTLKLKPDIYIYVKKITSQGLWCDQDICDIEENTDVDTHIAELERQLNDFIDIMSNDIDKSDDSSLPEIEKEQIRYHHKYRPQIHADYVFLRSENEDDE